MMTLRGEDTNLGKPGKKIELGKAQALENQGKRLNRGRAQPKPRKSQERDRVV